MKLFKWSDEFYDFVKILAIRIVPATETFWGILATAWDLPYGTQIGASIGGFGLFLALCLGLSNAEYQKTKRELLEEGE